jgi:hypothetical protein
MRARLGFRTSQLPCRNFFSSHHSSTAPMLPHLCTCTAADLFLVPMDMCMLCLLQLFPVRAGCPRSVCLVLVRSIMNIAPCPLLLLCGILTKDNHDAPAIIQFATLRTSSSIRLPSAAAGSPASACVEVPPAASRPATRSRQSDPPACCL